MAIAEAITLAGGVHFKAYFSLFFYIILEAGGWGESDVLWPQQSFMRRAAMF